VVRTVDAAGEAVRHDWEGERVEGVVPRHSSVGGAKRHDQGRILPSQDVTRDGRASGLGCRVAPVSVMASGARSKQIFYLGRAVRATDELAGTVDLEPFFRNSHGYTVGICRITVRYNRQDVLGLWVDVKKGRFGPAPFGSVQPKSSETTG
jgi:hypothetical protein